MIKVILEQDVEGLGKKGAAVKVKDGFARNYLIPRRFALEATAGNLKLIEKNLQQQEKRVGEEKKKAEELAKKIAAVSCTLSVDVHDDEQVYGSITSAHIASALEAEGILLDKKQILLTEPIKALGIYNIELKLHPLVTAKLKVWVVKK